MMLSHSGKVIQKDFIAEMMSRVGIPEKEAKAILKCFLNTISTEVLEKENSIALQCFGRFSVEHKAARFGRNPKTGESALIKPRSKVKFIAAKAMKSSIEEYIR